MRRKAPTPLVLFPSGKHQNLDSEYNWSSVASDHQERKTSVFSVIRRAAKKVAGVFAFVFSGPRKSTSEECRSEPGDSLSVDRESSFSSSTDYLSDSYVVRAAKRNFSGPYRFSGSRSKYSGKSSSSKTWHFGPVIFSFEELQKATENFSPANQIGEGGFGTVYKGRLHDGTLVAIKRARKNNYGRSWLLEFKNEIYTLSKIEHMNLVRLYGFLEHEDERVIVVEYVGNGNLREHLDGSKGKRLEMAERLEIAIDVAHAITYLHTYTDTPIIHRDIKATNILITEKLRAKVADFGFARLVSEDEGATHISTQVKGSAGYVDPDYLRTFQLTEKSDIYSFGVLVVELVSGRRPIESKRPRKERLTVKWAMQGLRDDEVVLVMDPVLRRSQASISVAEKMMRLARQCLASARSDRPSMKECVEMLWAIRREFGEVFR
ncbi:PREDICTED: calmodulin-binding receptor-like cytoplasmic kinase 1 [Tarenaya hassleriana]|uniref:calmodulin-binding receptor-like cytoplasmic kinase 1 n=1 Tax=Tarenaya hassleriana TaxID=28532 RepID=UPI00053C1E16|nr:PREDICTED: calmodulin-binding receptor-like cytoplasmic kinase 1 [Tarenaya hassleriana]